MSDIKKGDHVRILAADGNDVLCTVHHEDGTSELTSGEVNTGCEDSTPLERCPSDESGRTYHVRDGRRGPALYNTRAYCEGYEAIFAPKREDMN